MNSSFHLYQIVAAILAVIMIFQGVKRFLSGAPHQTFLKLFVRIVVWGGIALVAIFPNLSNFLAKIVGLQGNLNAVIVVGFLLVFLMIFKLLSAIERLEQNISELTRKDSLKNLKND